jgi:hypothetical protein
MRAIRLAPIIVSTTGILALWSNAVRSYETELEALNAPAANQAIGRHDRDIAERTGMSGRHVYTSKEVSRAVRLAQHDPSVASAGNPTIAPLQWAGLLLNIFEKDGKKYMKSCTAQFISSTVVLTAAHCVQDEETAVWYDPNRMYFLLQYQNDSFSQAYRPVCLSRFDGWWSPQLKSSQTTEEKNRARRDRYQWDYAMILVDRPSSSGFYKWEVNWQGKYRTATATGYPGAMLGGQIIQRALGEIVSVNVAPPQVVALKHNQVNLTQGSSGGAWVANFSKDDDANHNIIISLTSFISGVQPGVSFGPYLTSDFKQLFDYVSKGCP